MGRLNRDNKLKSLGLCTTCGKSLVPPGKRVCKACIEISVIRNREKFEKRKQEGVCVRCGKFPPAQDRFECKSCLAKAVRKTAAIRAKRESEGLCKKCGKSLPADGKLHCHNCLERNNAKNLEIKTKVMNHYGGKCACCGEDNLIFLSIDHINGGGDKHRRELGSGGGRLYRWIVSNNYPNDFQVLCFNCNQGRAVNGGVCPHQQETGGIRGCGDGQLRLVSG